MPRYAGPAGYPRSGKSEGPPAKLACGSDNAAGLPPSAFPPLGGAEGTRGSQIEMPVEYSTLTLRFPHES